MLMTALYVLSLILLLGLVAGLAYVGLLYLSRGNPIEQIRILDDGDPPEVSDSNFCRTIQFYVNTALDPGNRIELLVNGENVYPRLWDDLRNAQSLITWHVFWFKPGALADRVKECLTERARAGVRVLFLHDAFGSKGVGSDYFDELREAGVEVACFRPLGWNSIYKYQQRSHIRAVVIDGCIGYTGGFGIDDQWQGDGRHPGQWRDTSVRIEGRTVLQLQAAFTSDWAEATGELLIGADVYPEMPTEGDGSHVAGLVYSAPSIGSTDAERLFALSIAGARESLYITSAYFVPDDDFRRLLCEAVRRGTDVRVLTPGENTDKKSTWYAARCHYEELLGGGVRVYEYDPTMVHAKTLVVDGVWTTVGTMNFDNRSMSLNNEVVLMIHDSEFGARAKSMFMDDLEYATELELETFRRRGAAGKLVERAAVMFSRLL